MSCYLLLLINKFQLLSRSHQTLIDPKVRPPINADVNIQRKQEKDTSINDRNDEYNSSEFANYNSISFQYCEASLQVVFSRFEIFLILDSHKEVSDCLESIGYSWIFIPLQ